MLYCICRLKQSLTKCVISYPFRYCFIYTYLFQNILYFRGKTNEFSLRDGLHFILNNRMFYEYLKTILRNKANGRCRGFLFLFQKNGINFTSEFYRFSLPFAALFSIHKCVFVSLVFYVCYFFFLYIFCGN